MMPCVTVLPNPNGLPIASTVSPTCTESSVPKVIAGRSLTSAFSTARSESGSLPRTLARNRRPSDSTIWMSSAPSIM